MHLISSLVGVPKTCIVSTSWSTPLSPGNNGCTRSNSAMTQPVDQISIDVVYSLAPNMSSGAR
nr:Os03g0841850 [Ipomoea batatas]